MFVPVPDYQVVTRYQGTGSNKYRYVHIPYNMFNQGYAGMNVTCRRDQQCYRYTGTWYIHLRVLARKYWEATIFQFLMVYYLITFFSILVFISVIYFTSRIANNTEIVAYISSGASFHRFAKPYLIAALIIATAILAVNHFILPWSNIKKNKLEIYTMNTTNREKFTANAQISTQLNPQEYIFINSYNRQMNRGSGYLYQKFDKNKIVLKPVAKMPDYISANIIAVSTYEDASRIMTQNFKDQEFGDSKRKVKVTKVDLWHRDGKMIIALDMLGSIDGTIYLAGFPQYNQETKEIYFDQLDYVLNTKSFLVRSANWLAQGYVLRKIQESCRYSIKPNMEEGKANVMKYLQNYSPMKGVYINGTLNDFEFQKIQLTNKAILAFIKGSGQVDVKIDGIE